MPGGTSGKTNLGARDGIVQMEHRSSKTCPFCGAQLHYQRIRWLFFLQRYRVICPTEDCGYFHGAVLRAVMSSR